MAVVPGFCGPFNRTASHTFDVEDTIELLSEKPDAGTGKNRDGWLRAAPGTYPFWAMPAGPIRCLFNNGDGRAFAVGGPTFNELYANQTFLTRATMATDANPATIASNGTAISGGLLLAITSGGKLYSFDLLLNTFQQVTDDAIVDFNIAEVVYLSSTFIVRIANTNKFYYSDVNGIVFNGLSFFETSLTPDNKPRIIASHDNLWLLGTKKSEVWQNTGDADTPFQPIPGTVIDNGTGAPWSWCEFDNSIVGVTGNERGSRMVMRAEGFGLTRISTHAVEHYLNGLRDISQARGFAVQLEGHELYILNPSANEETEFSLAYDASSQSWTKLAVWDDVALRYRMLRAQNHMFVFDKHYVGDRRGRGILEYSFAYKTYAVAV